MALSDKSCLITIYETFGSVLNKYGRLPVAKTAWQIGEAQFCYCEGIAKKRPYDAPPSAKSLTMNATKLTIAVGALSGTAL